ncbi:uncharacterized protein [Rutidosis leptorrhynchoides]|uniref:uncharacterized protein n=1 Tax=Rutidosis leptorrhynchoides TaxID=125765 RepID=UPI003A995799
MENGKYESWTKLFKIYYQAFMVIDHIIPSTDSSPSTFDVTNATPNAAESWDHLNAIVLHWFHGTMSAELLGTVLVSGSTAQEAWDCLKIFFHDNRHTRAAYLTHKFYNTRLNEFPNMSAYCPELKHLSDQLSNVGPKIENDRLVLQLITGLGES